MYEFPRTTRRTIHKTNQNPDKLEPVDITAEAAVKADDAGVLSRKRASAYRADEGNNVLPHLKKHKQVSVSGRVPRRPAADSLRQ
jgi:hypothetical protein